MNSVIKQCIINRLDIPNEIQDIIKSYCFYDIISWETIQFIRYKKEIINDMFKNKVVYMAMEYDLYDEYDIYDEGHWGLWVNTPEDSDKCQFQGINCIMCGNYNEQYAPHYISEKIICNCDMDDDYDDGSYDYDSDDDASFGD